MTGGSARSARLPPALSPTSFLLDETPINDLLAMTRDYAGALTYVGADGRADGTWAELLDRDPAVLLARTASLRLGDRRVAILDDSAAGRAREMASDLRELADWLRLWFQALWRTETGPGERVSARLEWLVLRGLAPELAAISDRRVAASVAELIEGLEAWLDEAAPRRDHQVSQDTPQLLRNLRRLHFAFIEALERLQGAAIQEFGASVANARHEPAAALLLAIAQAFQRVQARVNLFTGRLLDFYYKECLGFTPRPERLDRADVVFERERLFARDVEIPAGQPFIAGQAPDGSPIFFTAEAALAVSDARVEQLKTLRLERDPLISPEHELGYVTRVKAASYAPLIGPGDGADRLTAPLLGGAVLGCVADNVDARLGLAISSPILWLNEGERRVDITLEIELAEPPPRKPSRDARPARTERAPPPRGEVIRRRLRNALAVARKPETFFRALGDLFAAWVLSDEVVLTDAAVSAIRRRAYRGRFIDPLRLGETGPDARAAADEKGEPKDVEHAHDDREIFLAHDLLAMMLGPLTADETSDRIFADEPDPASRADKLRNRRRLLARDEFFGSAFKIEVSTADGWFEIGDAAPSPKPPSSLSPVGFMRLAFELGREDPPVVACTPDTHGPEWPTDDPVLRLTVNPQCRLFPLSVFSNPTLKPALTAVTIALKVDGVKALQAYNQQGQLDPGKPFQPFGPLPDTSSYLVVGSPEAARKTITRHALALDWAALPPEGFRAHYDGYGDPELAAEAFRVREFVLRDGRWAEGEVEQPLFERDAAGRLAAATLVLGPVPLRASWRASPRPLVYDHDARSGFVKVQLSAPRAGFGHRAYPMALTEALRPVGWGKAAPPLPNPPYTPTLERVTLAYDAETRIVLGRSRHGDAGQVLLLHPFGVQSIHPSGPEAPHPVLPSPEPDGQLLIGLSGGELQAGLTLLFEMREEVMVERLARQGPKPRLAWSTLADNAWRPLEARRVVADSTGGFLTSGIVGLDLPPGVATGASVLPHGLRWIRLSSDALSGAFAGLQGVRAQAVRLERAPGGPPVAAPLAPGSITTRSAAIPGVAAISQPMASFGLRPAETEAAMRVRIAERLRHKQRATTPWDYERLVLDAFPTVQKVRCLPNVHPETGRPSRGDVVVVVVPAAPPHDPGYEVRPLQLDALELERIAAFLPRLASPFARVAVRNASYNFIQVRCRVTLRDDVHSGDVLKRINSRLVSLLSPWREQGYTSDFEWSVRSDDVEACIREVADVEAVNGISLIRVWEDNSTMPHPAYQFEDTAVAYGGDAGAVAVLSARPPFWSLALPLADHFVEVVRAGDGRLEPHRTGIADARHDSGLGFVAGLQIGETFIVGDGR
jgi:hypothetical protein